MEIKIVEVVVVDCRLSIGKASTQKEDTVQKSQCIQEKHWMVIQMKLADDKPVEKTSRKQ